MSSLSSDKYMDIIKDLFKNPERADTLLDDVYDRLKLSEKELSMPETSKDNG